MRELAIAVVLMFAGCKMNEKRSPAPPPPAAAKARSPYCAGTSEWAAGTHTCADDVACGSGERCYGGGVPDVSQMCGAAPTDEIHCDADRDCKHGMICQSRPGRCGSQIRECVPGCTPTSCEADSKCGKDLRCAPIACSDGYACGSGMRCGSGTSFDAHGCAAIPCWEGGPDCGTLGVCKRGVGCASRDCKTSADCPCGSCVDGTCHDRPGVCGPSDLPMPG